MGNGHFGTHGENAAKLVVEELRQDIGDVIPHHHMEVAKIVLENRQNQYDATQSFVLRVRLDAFYALNLIQNIMKMSFSYYLIHFLYHKFLGCVDTYPRNYQCKRQWPCSKLKAKCNKSWKAALSKKCEKKIPKAVLKKKVYAFCKKTCRKCGCNNNFMFIFISSIWITKICKSLF